MTEKEIDLFADDEKSHDAVTELFNEKMYQVVDLKNGTFQFKRYNGSKAEKRYTSLGYFKLRSKHFQEYDKSTSVHQRKEEAKKLGNSTVRRKETNVLTQAHEIVKMLNSEYEFEQSNNDVEMTDHLANLIEKIKQDLNVKYRKDKLALEIEMLDKLSFSMLDLDDAILSDEQTETMIITINRLYDQMNLFCKKQNKNKEGILEAYHKKFLKD